MSMGRIIPGARVHDVIHKQDATINRVTDKTIWFTYENGLRGSVLRTHFSEYFDVASVAVPETRERPFLTAKDILFLRSLNVSL